MINSPQIIRTSWAKKRARVFARVFGLLLCELKKKLKRKQKAVDYHDYKITFFCSYHNQGQ